MVACSLLFDSLRYLKSQSLTSKLRSPQLLLPHSMNGQQPPIFRLPNELLVMITQYVGPPDISCCDPGWVMLPAVCRLWSDITKTIRGWNLGIVEGPGTISTSYYWAPHLFDASFHQLPVPRFMCVIDKALGVKWSFQPVYHEGHVDYPCADLDISPFANQYRDSRQAIDEYLGGIALPHRLPPPNLTWMRSITIYCRHGEQNVNIPDFSFANVPCIVAPALQELTLRDYVVNWCCNGLTVLVIEMHAPDNGNNTNYCYSAPDLFARMLDSRLSLENVQLVDCFSELCNDDKEQSVLAVAFPLLRDFHTQDIMPHEAWWICQRITFPAGYPPIIDSFGPGLTFLRSLACEHVHSSSSVATPESSCGQIDMLTIRELGEDSPVTASRITSLDPIAGFDPELYAYSLTARLRDNDEDMIENEDIRELNRSTPGIEPVFVANLQWTSAAWDFPPTGHRDLCSQVPRVGLQGVRQVFINGQEDRLLQDDTDAEIWTGILRHLPNVRELYIHAPSSAALAPLLLWPDILPSLEVLWLGCSDGPSNRKIDAGMLLDIMELREETSVGTGNAFELRVVKLRLVGESRKVDDLCRLRGFHFSNIAGHIHVT